MSNAEIVSRVLRYPGCTFQVEGPREDMEWLVQFLGPSFSSRKRGEPEWRVRMIRDHRAFEDRLAKGPDSGRYRRPCFFLDTRTESLPLWLGPPGSTTVFDRPHKVFASVSKTGAGVDILGPPNARLPRLALMRIARERTLASLTPLPGLLLHASGVEVEGVAALIIGEKRSGKTSLMLHSLWQGNGGGSEVDQPVRFLANDRVWVSLDGNAPVARGFPTIASLRLSSLDFFPEITSQLGESTWAPALTLREARRSSGYPAKPWNGRKYTLSPIQLCRLLGVKPAAAAEVGFLLFPRVTGKKGRIRMTLMPPEEAEAALPRGLFRAGKLLKAGGIFAPRGYPRRLDTKTTAERIHQLVRRVPCFSVELGVDAYSDRGWVERLARKVRRGRVT